MSTTIFYTGGCGLYISCGQQAVLIDGLYRQIEGFSAQSGDTARSILKQQPPFTNIKGLLFTHRHPDHMDEDSAHSFIQNHPDVPIILPDNEKSVFNGETKASRQAGLSNIQKDIQLADMQITCIPTVHLTAKSRECPHYAYSIRTKDCHLFIAGDADPRSLLHNPLLPEAKFDFAFLNAYFIHLTPGRKVMSLLSPGQSYIYHLPKPEDDSLAYRSTALQNIQKFKNKMPPCKLLLQEGIWIKR